MDDFDRPHGSVVGRTLADGAPRAESDHTPEPVVHDEGALLVNIGSRRRGRLRARKKSGHGGQPQNGGRVAAAFGVGGEMGKVHGGRNQMHEALALRIREIEKVQRERGGKRIELLPEAEAGGHRRRAKRFARAPRHKVGRREVAPHAEIRHRKLAPPEAPPAAHVVALRFLQ